MFSPAAPWRARGEVDGRGKLIATDAINDSNRVIAMAFSALVVELLTSGGAMLAKGVLGEVGKGTAKDAYTALKKRLEEKHEVKTLDLIDRASDTPALKEAVEADIDNSGAASDQETLRLTEALRAAIADMPKETQIAYAIDGGRFVAGEDIIAREVAGLRNANMKAEGSIDLSGAKSPGKSIGDAAFIADAVSPAMARNALSAGRDVRVVIHQYYADSVAPQKATNGIDGDNWNDSQRQICPYRGLETFRATDAQYFAGRDTEIDQLEAALQSHDILGLIAASGAGKSSLVYAGLIPRLEQSDDNTLWDVFAFKPGREPLKSLSRALAGALGPYGDIDAEVEQINRRVRNFRSGDVPLRDLFERVRDARRAAHPDYAHRFLIFVDQWEELYTQVDNSEDRGILLRELEDAISEDGTQLLLTMRADFMGDILSHDRDFFESLKPGIQYLTPMSEDAMHEAIEVPANAVGLRLQDGLASQMVEDAKGESGYLAYLQFTLKQLWTKRDRASNTLTLNVYQAMGGLRGAIGKHADVVYRHQLTDAERSLARAVLPRLVYVSDHGSDISIRQPLSDFSNTAQALLRKLAGRDSRLVVLRGESEIANAQPDDIIVEVAHEALLRDWEALKGWITEREGFHVLRGRLDADAARWRLEQKNPDYLIPHGKPLLDAQALAQIARDNEISKDLCAYINASVQEEKHRQQSEKDRLRKEQKTEEKLRKEAERRLRVSRILLWGAIAATLVLMVLSLFTIQQRNQLIAREGQLLHNETAALTAMAQIAKERGFTSDAAKTVLAAWPKSSTDPRPALQSTWNTISNIAAHILERQMLKHDGPVLGAVYSPDATRILTWSDRNTVQLWDAQSGAALVTLQGHEGEIGGALYNTDATRVLTWSADNTARLWNAQSGTWIATLTGHERSVRGAIYSPDSTRILTWSNDNTARLWDAQSGLQIEILAGHGGPILDAFYNSGGTQIVTLSNDKTARVWDAHSGVHITTVNGRFIRFDGATYSPDERRILTWSAYETARLWDAQSGIQVGRLEGHSIGLLGATYSPDATRILTWSADHTARLWNAQSGAWIQTLTGHEGSVDGAVYSPDETHILTWSNDNTARLWDAQSGAQVAILTGHEESVRGAIYSPDSTRILTWSADNTARLWNAQSGLQIAILAGHDGPILDAFYSPDKSRLLTQSADHTARLWDTQSGASIATLSDHTASVFGAIYNHDQTRILTWSADNTARLWNAQTGAQVATLTGHEKSVLGAVYSPDETRILTWSDDNTARLWDAQSGAQVAILTGHEKSIAGVVYSPDETRILTSSYDKTARLWNAQTGVQIATLTGHGASVSGAVYSPDATRILTWSGDNTARLWDAQSGAQVATLTGHERTVLGAVYSPDETRILTWSYDNTARLWDAQSGAQVATLTGHEGPVDGAVYSPDETRILTWSHDKTARLWNAQTGAWIETLTGHERSIWGAIYSPDATRILTRSADSTARLWDAQSGAPLATFNGHEGPVMGAIYSLDATRIITWADESTDVRLWDAESGAELATLIGHEGQIRGALYSSHKNRILTWSDDNTARLWDVSSIPEGGIFNIICTWLPNHNLDDLADEYSLEISETICEDPGAVPLPYEKALVIE